MFFKLWSTAMFGCIIALIVDFGVEVVILQRGPGIIAGLIIIVTILGLVIGLINILIEIWRN